jgi:uncharacterized protein (DUF433 family)
MSAVEKLKGLLSTLGEHERALLLEMIARDLGAEFPGIERSEGVCGGDPRVVRTRIPVWLLAQARRQGLSDDDILRAYPTLRREDLAFAWAYCHLHADEIDEQIRENEAA